MTELLFSNVQAPTSTKDNQQTVQAAVPGKPAADAFHRQQGGGGEQAAAPASPDRRRHQPDGHLRSLVLDEGRAPRPRRRLQRRRAAGAHGEGVQRERRVREGRQEAAPIRRGDHRAREGHRLHPRHLLHG